MDERLYVKGLLDEAAGLYVGLANFEAMVGEWRRSIIRAALKRANGNQCQASSDLGIHRNTLSRWMVKLDITVEHYSQRHRPIIEEENHAGSGDRPQL